jgi:hypothetical protein
LARAVPGRVDLVQAGTESVSVTADDNVLPLIETVVEDGVLRIRFRGPDSRNVRIRTPIRIAVKARTVESIAVGGSGDVFASSLSGPALRVSVAGSGNVSLAGKAESLEARISGSGDVKAKGLDAARATVSISGSGDAVVVARSALRVQIAGSGDVAYYGDPALQKSVAGSGSVRRLGAAPG